MQTPYSSPYRREPAWVNEPSILRAISARPVALLVVTIAVFTLFAFLILNLPKEYESHMKLRLGFEEDATIPNTAEAKAAAAKRLETLDRQVNVEMEVLKSADTLMQVVQRTGLEKLEVAEDQGTGETTSLTLEKALRRLQDRLKIERVDKSNLVKVSYFGASGELAAGTLQSLTAVYPKALVKVYGEPGNYQFLHKQRAVWRRQMDDAENELVHFRRRYSEFVLPEERDALGRRTVEAQAAYEQADAQVAQYKRKVAEARQRLNALSPTKGEQNRNVLKSDAVGRAVMMLVDVIGRRADLDSGGPGAREAEGTIENAKATLKRTLWQASTDKRSDLNPVHQNAEVALIASETELAGYEALRDHLKQTAEAYKAQMFRLADAAIRDGALLRQVKESEEQYLLYSRWQEQAIANEGLAKENLLNFGVVERPTIPAESSAPHVGIDLWLSLLLSMCCGLAVVLCAEYLTPAALRNYAAVRTAPADLEVTDGGWAQ